MIVSVKVPEAATAPLPLKKVWNSPKLEPVGVFRLVDPRPVNVIINALPMPPKNVTELVPLPAHPPQVKVPDVVKVTGSAFAVEAPKANRPVSSAVIKDVFNKRAMFVVPFCLPDSTLPHLSRIGGLDTAKRRADSRRRPRHPVNGLMPPTRGANAGGRHANNKSLLTVTKVLIPRLSLLLAKTAPNTSRHADQARSQQDHACRFRNVFDDIFSAKSNLSHILKGRAIDSR